MLEGSILNDLRVAHQSGAIGKRPLNFGVYYKNTLVSLCHALEDCILSCSSAPLVITAFQRGKWYLQEADRYSEIADRADQIVIMASSDTGFQDHPTSQRSNVALVELDQADPVAQEWHLMILAPSYTAMVLCQELSAEDYGAQGIPTEDLERKFYGFWTFEAGLVEETINFAIEHIDQYNPDLAKHLRSKVAEIKAHPSEQDEIYQAVSMVVSYLQTEQAELRTRSKHEALDNNLTSNELQAFLRLAQLIDQTDISNPNAAAEVASLSEAMAQLLDLPAWQLNRLRLSALLHRLAFLKTSDSVLSPGSFGRIADHQTEAPCCPIVPGAQILRNMGRLNAIATIVTHQSEQWNGQGQPAGLAGDEIPLESRILGLLAEFQQRVTQHRSSNPETALSIALSECQAEAGDRWDSKLVEALTLLVSAMQQGLSLPIQVPKIAAGMWLLDSHSDEALLDLSAKVTEQV
ncbi:DICT sensory domain-containing protein [Leptolyngbya sp. NIES-2104]|uniref:DICT sensory domain-containing protein n=1 Tax=Leptolyngbya sp. NIES-2104 TaxID=1552121 RepID=UPI0006EC45A6|nr:DICT sensory domain-containing protein [Leptolyngbya sp. NIES-2104]GAP95868.1 two-component sensor histidine kinase [Leptolyngbya sp. NIES-2104]